MQLYLKLLADFYDQKSEDLRLLGWPSSFDALQEELGQIGLVAASQFFSRQDLQAHFMRRRLPLLAVSPDWRRFLLAIPAKEEEGWQVWEGERYKGRFSPAELAQQGFDIGQLLYLIIPRGWFPSPFSSEPISPLKRLFRLFSAEGRLVGYIYLYALTAGGANLLVPVIIQAIYTYIQTLQWVTGLSTLLLLAAVILIVWVVVRIAQYILLEHLQRRIFLHSTLEIVYRVPRWLLSAVIRENLPGLINRYFEIFTLEKDISKLLLNLPADLLTVLLGIILLSFYAPFFAFTVLLVTALVVFLLYLSFEEAYKNKKEVSNRKYEMASWLEEVARAFLAFKVTGFPALLYSRTQEIEEKYLTSREKYFRLLLRQKTILFSYQVVIALLMLGVGAALVIGRQLSLGQFVASELVLFLLINAIQDIIYNLDALYGTIVSIEKMNQIFEPKIEKIAGIPLPSSSQGYSVSFREVSLYRRQGERTFQVLKGITFDLQPGEKLGLTGPMGSGKTTLLYTLYGLHEDFEGDIYIEGVNLRQVDRLSLRKHIGDALEVGQIIEASVWDNLTLGLPHLSWEKVMEVCDRLGIKEELDHLPEGFFTRLPPQGRGVLSGLTLRKLVLARALLMRPNLLILEDLFVGMDWEQKGPLYDLVLDPEAPYTAIVVSQDPRVLQKCDKIALLWKGELTFYGTYADFVKTEKLFLL